jgi:ADP-ribose pyrophosphatase YjhB (NUDIX family)
MEIKSTLVNGSGQTLDVVYREGADPTKDLEGKRLHTVHGYCFWQGKLVVVYAENKGYWTPPGGSVEAGETYEEALVREIVEEANMRVISHELIGYQDIYEPDRIIRQTRSFCVVEPIGDFVADPDGDITEIKLIDPAEYKQYFDWKQIGDRIMQRALELHAKIASNS